jgi:polysaccharide pyruvyl transferase WcaK-like protein
VFGDFCLSETEDLDAYGPGNRRPVLAINVQQVPPPWNAEQARYEAALAALTRRMIRAATAGNAHTVCIFTTGSEEEAAPARRVLARLDGFGANLLLPGSLDELYNLLDTSALVLASRLHAGILALARGTAVVGFSPQPKLRRFFSTLGLGDYGFDLEAADQLVRRIEDSRPDAIAADQRERVRRAPIWACRARIRDELRARIGADPVCR